MKEVEWWSIPGDTYLHTINPTCPTLSLIFAISWGLTFHPDGFKTYNVPALLTTVLGLHATHVQWWWFALPIVKFLYQWVFVDFLVDNYLIYLDILYTVSFERINGKNSDLVWALHPEIPPLNCEASPQDTFVNTSQSQKLNRWHHLTWPLGPWPSMA